MACCQSSVEKGMVGKMKSIKSEPRSVIQEEQAAIEPDIDVDSLDVVGAVQYGILERVQQLLKDIQISLTSRVCSKQIWTLQLWLPCIHQRKTKQQAVALISLVNTG